MCLSEHSEATVALSRHTEKIGLAKPLKAESRKVVKI